MKRFFGILVVVAVLTTLPLAAQKAKEQTIKGEVVELSCYLKDGSRGKDHKECGTTCAKAGAPLAVLSKGKMYVILLADDHKNDGTEKLMPFIGEVVTVKGGVTKARNGVNGIVVSSVEPGK